MRRWIPVAVLVALLAILGRLLWSRWGTLGSPEAKLEGRFQTEEQWLVAEITQDIAEMALYAASPEAPARQLDLTIEGPEASGSPPTAKVSLVLGPSGRMSQDIVIRRYIWSPVDYFEFARAIGRKLALRAPAVPPSEDESLLAALLNPLPRVIETQNQRVSATLRSSMLDPGVHEQAALVVGSLALREAAGRFSDVRQLLCRMTAHLALAGALRGDALPGISGRYAEVVLATQAGRDAEAMETLKGLGEKENLSESQAAWIRALSMKSTYDWRTLQDPPGRTLLERREYFGAVTAAMSPSAALSFLPMERAEPLTDWARLTLQGYFGTEAGLFADDVEDEIAEASDIWMRTHGEALPRGEVVEALNQPAERCLTPDGPRVLGWGAWAASLQRHLCQRVLRSDAYWRGTVALDAQGRAKIADFDHEFGALDLYPFVQSLRWRHGQIELESFIDDLRTAIATAAQRPELVPVAAWDGAREVSRYAVIRRRMPDPRRWFGRPIPYGTTYEAYFRLSALTPPPGGAHSVRTLRDIDPWNYFVISRLLEETHGKAVAAGDIRREFGARADYDLGVLRWMANVAKSFEERREILERRCEILADECIDVGNYLVEEKRDEEAAKALQRAFDAANDRVVMANNSRFLIHHYFSGGRVKEARRIAEAAADAGSAAGLATMGELLEWQGKFEEAEEYFRRIERRYGQSGRRDLLMAFYHRMVWIHGQPAYERKFRSLSEDVFPDGLERLDPEKLSGRPSDGAHIISSSDLLRRFGLSMGDVVVGLDGWRVHNEDQYHAVNLFNRGPDMRLYVWRKDRYLEMEARIVSRHFGVNLKTFP